MGWKNSVNSDLGQKRAVLDFGPHGQLQAQSVTLQQKLVQIKMQVYTKYKKQNNGKKYNTKLGEVGCGFESK